jgi:endonuclease/exonuclease/phosphatase family metal-dependent hydrolase
MVGGSIQALHGLKQNFRVLTQNCWMMPFRRATVGPCRSARLDAFGNWLEDQETAFGLDVVLLQDLWHDNGNPQSCLECIFGVRVSETVEISTAIASLFPYMTKTEPDTSCCANQDFADSGLCIASKHPIISEMFFAFPSKSLGDSLSKKGALLVAIALPNRKVAIIANAHLDAGVDDGLRFDQLDMCLNVLADFTRKVSDSLGRPITFTILGGDFNLDGNCDPVYEILEYRLLRFGFADLWEKFRTSQDGATYDMTDASPQRLDYLWINPIPSFAQVSVSEAKLWRADKQLRAEIQDARVNGHPARANALVKMLDGRNRFGRVTHHGAVLAEFEIE